MGSPVSPIVANVYGTSGTKGLDHGTWQLQATPVEEIMWMTFLRSWRMRVSSSLLTISTIQFTYEIENEGSIPFLDTLICIGLPDGYIKFSVYRKPTHTDQYRSFESHHHSPSKLGVVHTMRHRCETVVTDPEDNKNETSNVTTALTNCGYPTWTWKCSDLTCHYCIFQLLHLNNFHDFLLSLTTQNFPILNV